MRIPSQDSLNQLVDEISQKDYALDLESGVKTQLEFPEQEQAPFAKEPVVRILKTNYAEPSKRVQALYESQFRSFSRSNTNNDSFESLLE